MKIKGIIAFASAAFMLTSAAAFAEEEKALVDVSGKLFFDYSYNVNNETKTYTAGVPTKTKTTGQNSFNLSRAYVTFDKKIDDAWSARVTLDGGTLDQKDSGGDTTKSSSAFVKNAYAQYKTAFEPVELKAQAGLVGTPVIDLLDGLIGSRWIYQNYVDKSSDITGKSVDVSSADTGVKAEVKIMKMVSITGMYANGDGYKLNTTDQTPTTKSYYGTLNINPIEALNIFGYYHRHDTAAADKAKNFMSYYGGGLAWKDKSFKVGANYTLASGKTADVKEESSVLELWGNINLNEIAGAPVLVIGRYAMGTYEKKAAAKEKNEGSAIWGGLGYQLNKNVQLAAMYKIDSLTKKTSGAKTSDASNNTFYVKSEVVF